MFWRSTSSLNFLAAEAKGVAIVRDPQDERYGTVAVFRDLYGNLWDLLEPKFGLPD
jgi:uncharacterized glyoxalase superfamily protein PhnB